MYPLVFGWCFDRLSLYIFGLPESEVRVVENTTPDASSVSVMSPSGSTSMTVVSLALSSVASNKGS